MIGQASPLIVGFANVAHARVAEMTAVRQRLGVDGPTAACSV